jgi:hypothetical protein
VTRQQLPSFFRDSADHALPGRALASGGRTLPGLHATHRSDSPPLDAIPADAAVSPCYSGLLQCEPEHRPFLCMARHPVLNPDAAAVALDELVPSYAYPSLIGAMEGSFISLLGSLSRDGGRGRQSHFRLLMGVFSAAKSQGEIGVSIPAPVNQPEYRDLFRYNSCRNSIKGDAIRSGGEGEMRCASPSLHTPEHRRAEAVRDIRRLDPAGEQNP